MKKTALLSLVVLAGALAAPAWAQMGPPLRLAEPAEHAQPERLASRYRLGPGLNTPAVQAAARLFHQARADGRAPGRARKGYGFLDVGDTLTFNTERFLGTGWQARHFTLLFEGEDFNLWVETAERDSGHVQDADIDALVEALSARTPPPSVNPEAGILENNTTLFGALPNYDGDGVLDILWFDIFDDYPSGPPLVGYFAPEDYDPNAPSGIGNQADVLYLDTDPLLIGEAFGIEEVKQVAVQVHQQLIHFNQNPDEHPFVSRGLAEWAKLLNGYDACDDLYLQFPNQEHNIGFLSWNPIEPFLGDVQRAALFTTYWADQLGREAAVALVPEPASGAAGYRAVLQAQGATRSVEDMVMDFHTANFLNDTALDPRFGYTTPACAGVKALPRQIVDAGAIDSLGAGTLVLNAGGVQYFVWENVRHLQADLRVNTPALPGRVRLRAVLEEVGGAVSVVDVDPGEATFAGNYTRVVLILVYNELDDEQSDASVTLALAWDGPAVFTENIVYDDGEIAGEQPNFIRLSEEPIQAVRFAVPAGTRLAKVLLAPYFENQFTINGVPLGSPTDPRDFRLHVWADDGMGRPGDELFTLEQSDPRSLAAPTSTLNHFSVDLSAYPELSTLPEEIYVGFSNTGADDNHLVFALAPYAGDTPAFLFSTLNGSDAWRSLSALDVGGQSLRDRVIPIRAQFQGGILRTTVDEAEAPSAFAVLHPNYPNPFNPRTTIRYSVPQAAEVRLAVYDILGREMAVLVEALQAAGEHRVSLDASAWASGVYFYTIQTPTHRLSRSMLLVK